jgi:hypothetical protein
VRHKIAEDLLAFAQPIEALIPDSENTNTHDSRSIAAIARSLDAFGQQKPIVINRDGVVRAGNGTLEAARSLGWTHVAAALFTGGGVTEEKAYGVADNKIAELSEWDDPALAASLDRYLAPDATITAETLGFDEDDVRAIQQRAQKILGGADDAAANAEWDDGGGGGGDGEGGGGSGGEPDRITYTIEFDDERQKGVWQGFLRLLKNNYPEFGTPSARLLAHIREAGAHLT